MAAEKRPTTSHRGTDIGGGDLSIEERYDEVRQLINIGKEKGYLLYDEVNELLPSEITSSDELDDLFNTFGSAGIEVIDSDQKYLRDDVKPIDRTQEGAEEVELDLTPAALDKTNDPVRMYLREMGTVPLLTREGEREKALPQGPPVRDARADRAVAAHPRDRVHRVGQAAPHRRDEGRRRERQARAARGRVDRPPAPSQEQEAAQAEGGRQEEPPAAGPAGPLQDQRD